MALSKTDWEGLNDKARWDIQVALRGPDSHYGETIKWYTTSVIRGYCRKVFRVGGLVNDDLKLVVLPEDARRPTTGRGTKDRDSWNAAHFIEHVQAAANWIGIPIIYLPVELWFSLMQQDNIGRTGKQILEYLKTLPVEESPVRRLRPNMDSAKNSKELERHLRDSGYSNY